MSHLMSTFNSWPGGESWQMVWISTGTFGGNDGLLSTFYGTLFDIDASPREPLFWTHPATVARFKRLRTVRPVSRLVQPERQGP